LNVKIKAPGAKKHFRKIKLGPIHGDALFKANKFLCSPNVLVCFIVFIESLHIIVYFPRRK
jgi:hypothetical protein